MWFTLTSSSPWAKSFNCIAFLAVSIIQGLVVIVLEGLIFQGLTGSSPLESKELKNTDSIQSLSVYMIIFMVAQVFQVILSVESVIFKNTIQIFGVLLFNLMTLVYAIFQFTQINRAFGAQDQNELESFGDYLIHIVIAVTSVIAVCQLLLSYLSFKLFQEFGWSIYRKLGSDLTMRKYYMCYHFLVMLLKFDVYFFFGFTYQYLIFSIKENDFEHPLTIASIPISIFAVGLVIYSVQKERTIPLMTAQVGLILGVAYFVFKIVRIFTKVDKYKNYQKFLGLFGFLSLFFFIATIVLIFLCYLHFGKGLRQYIEVRFRKDPDEQRRPLSLNLSGE